MNGTSDITATDDKDVNAQVDVSIVALTTDADRRVTSAIADMAEPALTVVSDGGVTAPDLVKTKLELGEDYGMRGASALGKEWYEHSEGFCDALKGGGGIPLNFQRETSRRVWQLPTRRFCFVKMTALPW